MPVGAGPEICILRGKGGVPRGQETQLVERFHLRQSWRKSKFGEADIFRNWDEELLQARDSGGREEAARSSSVCGLNVMAAFQLAGKTRLGWITKRWS